MKMSESEKMLQALQQEDLAQAQLAFQQALRTDDEETLAGLGEELLQLGFLEEVNEIFQVLLKKNPKQVGYYLPLAEVAIENNEIETAFEALESIPKTSEFYAQALLITADLYQVLGIPEVSEAKLKEALEYVDEQSVILFALAELYFTTDRYQEAYEYYQKVDAKHFDLPSVSLIERQGVALSMMGQFEEAVLLLEQALEEEETDDRLFQLAFVYLQIEEHEKAIHYLQKLRVLNPQYEALYLFLAETLQKEELLQEAQEVVEEGINENPYRVELYHFASENAYRLNEVKKAEQFLIDALEIGERMDDTLLILSNLYIDEGFYEEALDAIRQMENQDQPFALWNRAKASYELEEFAEAAKYYALANEQLHHEIDFMKEYGLFLREEGQLEEAIQLLTHYLAHEPGDLEVQSILDDLAER